MFSFAGELSSLGCDVALRIRAIIRRSPQIF